MMNPREALMIPVALLASLMLAATLSAGCSARTSEGAEVTSAWPVANAERKVPQPPTPPTWPLTGLPAPDAEATERRAVSVKIENSPQSRPQTGVGDADVVYESVTEGGITRLNAIFHSRLPSTVGPVRSARLSDIWIVPSYDALFFFSGGSSTVNGRIRTAGIENLSEDVGVVRPYYRSSRRASPHNLYLEMDKAYAEATRRSMSVTGAPQPMRFSERVDSTASASAVTVPLSQIDRVRWEYVPAEDVYRRSINGTAQKDAASGEQIEAANVVVVWARHKPAGRDSNGDTTFDIQLGGSGRATLFRDGVKEDVQWEAEPGRPPVLRRADGSVAALHPGSTWFEVARLSVNIVLE
jgi:hypothetical protein